MSVVGNIKRWWVFILTIAIYLTLLGLLYSVRIQDFHQLVIDRISRDFGGCDYSKYTILSAIISTGVSPYDNHAYFYMGVAQVPVLGSVYAGYTTFCAILIRLTVVSPEVVVYVLTPLLFSISLPVVVWFFGRKMRFSPEQTTLFFILLAFVCDHSVSHLTHADGEVFGILLALIGLAFFLNKEYTKSILPLFLAVTFNPLNLIVTLVLVIDSVLSLIDMNLKSKTLKQFVESMFVRIGSFQYRRGVSLFMVVALSLCFVYPSLKPVTIYWANPPAISPDSVTFDVVKPQITIPYKEFYLESAVKGTTTVLWDQAKYLCPQTFSEMVFTFCYPLTYIYWGYPQRTNYERILNFLGHNLTQVQEDNMRKFVLTLDNLLPVSLLLLLGSGLPALFLLVVVNLKHISSGGRNLFLSAYLFPVALSLFYFLFRWSIFPQRSLVYVGVYLSVVLAMSGCKFLDSNYFKVIVSMYIFRMVLWVAAIISIGGI